MPDNLRAVAFYVHADVRGGNGLAFGWQDQERGIKHHFAVLLPCLTAAGKRKFEAALAAAERVA